MKRTLTSLFALSLFATAAPLFADDALESELDEKTAAWVGTPWGLGTPQSEVPNVGKINCGMFDS